MNLKLFVFLTYGVLNLKSALGSTVVCGNLQEGNVYYVTNKQYKCIVCDMSPAIGNTFSTYPLGNLINQQFYVKQLAGTQNYLIISFNSNYVFDINSTSSLKQQKATCQSSQQFSFVDASNSTCYIYSATANLVLKSQSSSTCSTQPIILAALTSTVDQQWYFQQAAGKTVTAAYPNCSLQYQPTSTFKPTTTTTSKGTSTTSKSTIITTSTRPVSTSSSTKIQSTSTSTGSTTTKVSTATTSRDTTTTKVPAKSTITGSTTTTVPTANKITSSNADTITLSTSIKLPGTVVTSQLNTTTIMPSNASQFLLTKIPNNSSEATTSIPYSKMYTSSSGSTFIDILESTTLTSPLNTLTSEPHTSVTSSTAASLSIDSEISQNTSKSESVLQTTTTAETVIATTTIPATEARLYNAITFPSPSSWAAESTEQGTEYTPDTSVGYDFSTSPASTLQSTTNDVVDDESSTTEETTVFNMLEMGMNQETTTQSATTPAYQNTLNEFEIPTPATAGSLSYLSQLQEVPPFYIQTLNSSWRQQMGYSLRQIIYSCTYNSIPCDFEEDFMELYNPKLGNCYIFNPGVSPKYWASHAGPSYGLRMFLISNQNEYPCWENKPGIAVAIDQNGVQPFPDSVSYMAQLGSITSLSLLKQTLIRRGPPYGNCVSKTNISDFLYSVEACQRSCFQQKMLDSCKCADPRYDIPPNAVVCQPSQKSCLDYNQLCEADTIQDCICPPVCNESMYTTVETTSTLLLEQYQNLLCNTNTPYEIDCSQDLNKQFALLEVYYQNVQNVKNVEVGSYEFVDLYNGFANVVGSMLGIGVITILELSYLILLSIQKMLKVSLGL